MKVFFYFTVFSASANMSVCLSFNFRPLSVLYTNVHNQSIYGQRVITAHCTCVQSDFNAFKHVRYMAHSHFST